MITSACEWCGAEIRRPGNRPGRFCSLKCKAAWQRTQKPVDEAWLRQKYLVENLSTYEIAKVVNRNPKQVYTWLVGYGIPVRERKWSTSLDASRALHSPEWLRSAYCDRKLSAEEIAAEAGTTGANVLHLLRKFHIPRRNTSAARSVKHWGLVGNQNAMYGKRGPECASYVDGSAPERQSMYARCEGRDFLRAVYKRDGYRCVRCGAPKTKPRSIHAHHIKPWAGNPALRFDLENLVTLCQDCHTWVHSSENTEREYRG